MDLGIAGRNSPDLYRLSSLFGSVQLQIVIGWDQLAWQAWGLTKNRLVQQDVCTVSQGLNMGTIFSRPSEEALSLISLAPSVGELKTDKVYLETSGGDLVNEIHGRFPKYACDVLAAYVACHDATRMISAK